MYCDICNDVNTLYIQYIYIELHVGLIKLMKETAGVVNTLGGTRRVWKILRALHERVKKIYTKEGRTSA